MVLSAFSDHAVAGNDEKIAGIKNGKWRKWTVSPHLPEAAWAQKDRAHPTGLNRLLDKSGPVWWSFMEISFDVPPPTCPAMCGPDTLRPHMPARSFPFAEDGDVARCRLFSNCTQTAIGAPCPSEKIRKHRNISSAGVPITPCLKSETRRVREWSDKLWITIFDLGVSGVV